MSAVVPHPSRPTQSEIRSGSWGFVRQIGIQPDRSPCSPPGPRTIGQQWVKVNETHFGPRQTMSFCIPPWVDSPQSDASQGAPNALHKRSSHIAVESPTHWGTP